MVFIVLHKGYYTGGPNTFVPKLCLRDGALALHFSQSIHILGGGGLPLGAVGYLAYVLVLMCIPICEVRRYPYTSRIAKCDDGSTFARRDL